MIRTIAIILLIASIPLFSACGSTNSQGTTVPKKNTANTTTSSTNSQLVIKFTQLPFAIKYVGAVSPLGLFNSSSRIDPDLYRPYGNNVHLIWNKTPGVSYEIYAPASASLTSFRSYESYRLDFGNNNVFYYFDGIVKLEPSLEAKIRQFTQNGSIEYSSSVHALSDAITIEAGELLGYTGWNPTTPESAPLYWEWGLIDKSYSKGINNSRLYYSWMFPHSRSIYDFATQEVQSKLAKIAGKWNAKAKQFSTSNNSPIFGSFGNDMPNNLCGVWYYNKDDNETWGPKIAIFAPDAMDASAQQIRLSIPEVNLYGSWTGIATQETGRINRRFNSITQEAGIYGYTLDNATGKEDGFLLVSLIEKNKIKLETLKDYIPSLEAYTASTEVFYFTKKAIELYR